MTACRICGGTVRLDEPARPITVEDAGTGLFPYYAGCLDVAAASCSSCGAKYLAWVSAKPGRRLDGGHWRREPGRRDERLFVDLSFRASFNDEPAAEDLPSTEVLQQIHAAGCLEEARECRNQAYELIKAAEAHEVRATNTLSFWETYRRL